MNIYVYLLNMLADFDKILHSELILYEYRYIQVSSTIMSFKRHST